MIGRATPDRVLCPGSGQTAHIAPLKPPYRGAGCPSCGRSIYVKADGTFSDHISDHNRPKATRS